MNIAVDEAYRRNGVGRSLMQSLEAVGKKMDVSAYFLEVRESNAAARKLYESMEFRNIGVRKHYYREPVEDAIIMSKVYRLEDEFDA
jgi:ribosomal-protein-alanine N-acetyltransferase